MPKATLVFHEKVRTAEGIVVPASITFAPTSRAISSRSAKGSKGKVNMALKTIRVRIKSIEDALDDAIGVMRAIQTKKKVGKQKGEYFESLEAVRATLTETRLALLRLIREREPESVAALARMAKRDFKAVYRDVEALRDLGLIQSGDRRRGASTPLRSDTTEIVLRIAV
jgi:predicted transcriptional regulator